MKDKVSPRSGVLDCEQGCATFYEENYDFRIMNSVPFKAASINTKDLRNWYKKIDIFTAPLMMAMILQFTAGIV